MLRRLYLSSAFYLSFRRIEFGAIVPLNSSFPSIKGLPSIQIHHADTGCLARRYSHQKGLQPIPSADLLKPLICSPEAVFNNNNECVRA
jgi:hypothetical protein